MKKLLAIAATTLFGATGAHATTISTNSYVDYVSGNPSSGYVFEDDGVTMKVTAGLYDDDAAATVTEGKYNARPVLYSGYGMGVSHDQNDGEHTVDGYFPEVLILAFDTTVKLTDLVFYYANSYAKFDFFIDSNDDGTLDQRVLIDSDLDSGYDSVSLSDLLSMDLLTGKLFGVGTSYTYKYCDHCSLHKSQWKLKKVKFEDVPDVPLPAALPLFLAGIAGFGFASRKKKA